MLRDVVRYVPMDRLLVETDSPYLAPVPFRGKENFPAYVVEVAKQVAVLKNLSYEGLFIELKNSALFFVSFNLELINSIASIVPIGAIILLKTFIF